PGAGERAAAGARRGRTPPAVLPRPPRHRRAFAATPEAVAPAPARPHPRRHGPRHAVHARAASLISPHQVGNRVVGDEVTPVLAVHLGDLVAHLALETLHGSLHAAHLLLEPDHVLDAREVEPELLR